MNKIAAFFCRLFGRKKPKEIKIGLALGSGGAKGFAELGVLRAFEENDVKFDMVAGTSIGGIIGAFYSDGYTSTDIGSLISNMNFSEIISGLMFSMDTDGLFKVLNRELGGLTFEELRKPFAAVATAFDTGAEKVFSSGNVAKALCASACYLPYFKPVVIDGIKYVDGAYVNSVPADVVKNMGADYVIGVDLSVREKKSGFMSKVLPSYDKRVAEPWKKGYDNADVVIHPDLKDFKSTSSASSEKMFDLGYRAAMQVIPKIKEDIQNLKCPKKKKK